MPASFRAMRLQLGIWQPWSSSYPAGREVAEGRQTRLPCCRPNQLCEAEWQLFPSFRLRLGRASFFLSAASYCISATAYQVTSLIMLPSIRHSRFEIKILQFSIRARALAVRRNHAASHQVYTKPLMWASYLFQLCWLLLSSFLRPLLAQALTWLRAPHSTFSNTSKRRRSAKAWI